MLTMFEDDESVFAALKAGARGYVLKDADRGTLLRAIRCARRSTACSLHRTTGAGSIYPHGAAAIDHSNRATITRRTFYRANL
jgi:DNA-binding NarL/FixJ family response regulator